MATDYTPPPWDEALYSFIQHLKGTSRADKTVQYYRTQLRTLTNWAEDNRIPIDKFGKGKLDDYIVWRKEHGSISTGKPLSAKTIFDDRLCARKFMEYCSRYDLVPRNLLHDAPNQKPPKPFRYMPSEDEIARLLVALEDYWDPGKNRPVQAFAADRRGFHRVRNVAATMLLLDSACRVGEAMALKLGDMRHAEVTVKGKPRTIWQLTIRESGSSATTKGHEARYVPLSDVTAVAVDEWLKVRKRVMKNAPRDADEGWLFIAETGAKNDEMRYTKMLQRVAAWAELPKTNAHQLRRFSLNKLSKVDLLAAQRIAGHKDTKTTIGYTELDAGHVADVHERAGVMSGIIAAKKVPRKRLV